MPTLLRAYGFRFHFYAADLSEPPHVHVQKDGKEAKIWLHNLKVVETGGFNSLELRRIVAITKEHRDDFLRSWHEFGRSR